MRCVVVASCALAARARAARAQSFAQGADAPFAATVSPPPPGSQRDAIGPDALAGGPFSLALFGGVALAPYERTTFYGRGVPRDAFAPYAARDFAATGLALGLRAPVGWSAGVLAHGFPLRPYWLGGGLWLGLGGAGGDASAMDPAAASAAMNQALRWYEVAAGPALQLSAGALTVRATLLLGLRATSLALLGYALEGACDAARGCPASGPSPDAWALRPLVQARLAADVRAARLGPAWSLMVGAHLGAEAIDGVGVFAGLHAGVRLDPRPRGEP